MIINENCNILGKVLLILDEPKKFRGNVMNNFIKMSINLIV